MSNKNEDVHATDQLKAKVETQPGKVVYARVRVTAKNGIFKNGKQYDQDEEAVITLHAAQNFERVDEVEILDVNVNNPEADK